jgi:hypothetical protein
MTESTEGAALEATAESDRFDQLSITLHWLTVLLIVVLFASAWAREAVDHDTRLASTLMTAHRTTGVVTWIVGWVRLVWRYNLAYLPPFPASMPKLQQWIAKANEYGLYAFASGAADFGYRQCPVSRPLIHIVHLGNAGSFRGQPGHPQRVRGGSRVRRPGAPHPHWYACRRRALPPPSFARPPPSTTHARHTQRRSSNSATAMLTPHPVILQRSRHTCRT